MSSYVFSQVPHVEIPRSTFDRSHEYKSTISGKWIYPIYFDEILPGDTVSVNSTNVFIRMATLIAPIMYNIQIDLHWFFVHESLVWEHFERMCGQQEYPGQSTDFTFPVIYQYSLEKSDPELLSFVDYESIFDYMGVPPNVEGNTSKDDPIPARPTVVRAEPFRAYNLIWRDWYKDENLQSDPVINKSDISYSNEFTLLPRNKKHDYFTSGLPWPVKDGTGVELPIHGTATIDGLELSALRFPGLSVNDPSTIRKGSADFSVSGVDTSLFMYGSTTSAGVTISDAGKVLTSKTADVLPKVNLSNSVTTTINEFREAFQVQKWLERCARSGSRYTEIIRSMFGTISPDARLQRAEFLGGSTVPIDISVVPQTSASLDGVTPQANLSAFAVGRNSTRGGFTKSFTEHGWIFCLASIRSNPTYQQGLNRMLFRRTKFDMYWPTLAHLGEQSILNKEIYLQGNAVLDDITGDIVDDQVFAFQERWAEYRYHPNMITGKFRSSYSQSLDFWHLSQYFEELPKLNGEFIVDDPPLSRVIAVQDEPVFILDAFFSLKFVRCMPLYSVPGLVDHF